MVMASQIIVGVLTLPMLALGFKCLLKPTTMLEDLAIDPRGEAGLNTIRGMMGGLFLSCATMLILALVTGNTVWLLSVAAIMAWAAVGRLIGIAADGFDKAVTRPLIVEIVMALALGGVHLHAAG